MNYQNVACWGDSQTFGARSYGCYPLHLARLLNAETRYRWRVLNYSTNGHTARDLWFRLAHELPNLKDVYQACMVIGANDVGTGSPVALFEEYYRQALDAFSIAKMRVVHCGEIPPIHADGHAFFAHETADLRAEYNAAIARAVEACPIADLVTFEALTPQHFCDPVHLNEEGNVEVARAFARRIIDH